MSKINGTKFTKENSKVLKGVEQVRGLIMGGRSMPQTEEEHIIERVETTVSLPATTP